MGQQRMGEVSITVRGTFHTVHPPERATVFLSVTSEGATKDSVFAAASHTANSVSAHVAPLFDRERGPVTAWSSDQVHTWSHRPWNKDGRQLPQVHHAGVQFRVTFSDFEALSKWLGSVGQLSGVSVSGIEWTLTDARRTGLTNEARTAAVHDARDKAQAYADSLGLGAVRPVAIADVGMLAEHAPTPMGSDVRLTTMAAASGESSEINFSPQDIDVAASVDARFLAG